MVVMLKGKKQRTFHVWENIHLVWSATADEAWAKAEMIGREHEGDSSETQTLNGQPAITKFAGVRRLIECLLPKGVRPEDGLDLAEISYNEYCFRNKKSFDAFCTGEEIDLVVP